MQLLRASSGHDGRWLCVGSQGSRKALLEQLRNSKLPASQGGLHQPWPRTPLSTPLRSLPPLCLFVFFFPFRGLPTQPNRRRRTDHHSRVHSQQQHSHVLPLRAAHRPQPHDKIAPNPPQILDPFHRSPGSQADHRHPRHSPAQCVEINRTHEAVHRLVSDASRADVSPMPLPQPSAAARACD